jgi:palmitoyltransferase
VYNCIGINNHRHFFIYLINLTLGVLAYDVLTYRCLSPFLSPHLPITTY